MSQNSIYTKNYISLAKKLRTYFDSQFEEISFYAVSKNVEYFYECIVLYLKQKRYTIR